MDIGKLWRIQIHVSHKWTPYDVTGRLTVFYGHVWWLLFIIEQSGDYFFGLIDQLCRLKSQKIVEKVTITICLCCPMNRTEKTEKGSPTRERVGKLFCGFRSYAMDFICRFLTAKMEIWTSKIPQSSKLLSLMKIMQCDQKLQHSGWRWGSFVFPAWRNFFEHHVLLH